MPSLRRPSPLHAKGFGIVASMTWVFAIGFLAVAAVKVGAPYLEAMEMRSIAREALANAKQNPGTSARSVAKRIFEAARTNSVNLALDDIEVSSVEKDSFLAKVALSTSIPLWTGAVLVLDNSFEEASP